MHIFSKIGAPDFTMKITEVFIAGGLPHVTYNPRGDLELERQIRRYLDQRYKILSVSGPTKAGKTVLIKKMVPKEAGIWVSGGQVNQAGVFWDLIISRTGAFTTIAVSESESKEDMAGRQFKASVAPLGFGGAAESNFTEKTARVGSVSSTRIVANAVTAIETLIRSKLPLIIDDFHYIPSTVQQEIIRSLKDPIFEGLPVILISVPHRAFDAVKLEREMTGRLEPLPIPHWSESELLFIAQKGFDTLNFFCHIDIAKRLVSEAFGSPHLMQDFCLALCRDNHVSESAPDRVNLSAPSDWFKFFSALASQTSKLAFDRLAQGPRSRTDRLSRKLKDGTSCDIYVAVLLAIASSGPKQSLSYEDIRAGLRKVLADNIPQANEVSFTLQKMSEIAREEIEGEPVVDWDTQNLHISDPFFAFYLRWGLKLPAVDSY